MCTNHIDPQDPFKKGSNLDDGFTIVGETTDGMPVATDGEYFFLTDGDFILSDGYDRIDALGYYQYVCWRSSYSANIRLDAGRINKDTLAEVRESHELA